MRLKEVVSAAGLGLTLKIGGCEAIRDMYEARVLGVARIVAPMIESPYALQKFLARREALVPRRTSATTWTSPSTSRRWRASTTSTTCSRCPRSASSTASCSVAST